MTNDNDKETHSKRLAIISARNEHLQAWAAILGVIVSLIIGVSAHFKEEKTAKAAYQELSQAVKNISKGQVNLHKDISNVRGYLKAHRDLHFERLEESRIIEEEFVEEEFAFEEEEEAADGFGFGMGSGAPPAPAKRIEKAEMVEEEIPEMQSTPQQYEPPPVQQLAR